METLESLLDAVRQRAGSDRKSAPLLGVSQQAISHWRTERAFPNDEQAARIAELLQLDAAFVLAVIHGERAKSKETRATWQRVAQAFGKAATVAAFTIGASATPSSAPAQGNSAAPAQGLCIM